MIISEKKKETIIILYLHHVAPCAHNKPAKATLRPAFGMSFNFRG